MKTDSMHTAVRSLFHQLSELPTEDREVALAQVQRRDPRTAREVARLLHHHSDVPVFESEVSQRPTLVLNRDESHDHHDSLSKADTCEQEDGSTPGPVTRASLIRLVGGLTLAAITVAAALAWFELQQQTQNSVAATLRNVSASRGQALKQWLNAEEQLIRSWAAHPDLKPFIQQLNQTAQQQSPKQELAKAPALIELRQRLDVIAPGAAFAVWNREGVLLADSCEEHFEFLGNGTTEYGASLLSRVLGHGETVLWLPAGKGFITEGFELKGETTKPGIAFLTPVTDTYGRPVAAALFASERYQKTLDQTLSQFARSNVRTYVIDRHGGVFGGADSLWSREAAASSRRAVERVAGRTESDARPLSRAAAACAAREDGTDCSGYIDPRGKLVCGSWLWLPECRFGVIAEIDHESAFAPVTLVQTLMGSVGGILVLGLVVGLLFQRQYKESSETPVVDGYVLQSQIGAGGFAEVWKARHQQLRRTVAIKILRAEQCTLQNISRFEREVRLACRLRNPNTIAIHDWGETPDGQFYCVMEYLNGMTLQELVEGFGPVCEARTVWILTSVCQSLNEAHRHGLVHRDVKPQNVMLCEQGGACDIVKVVDFGLARNPDDSGDNQITQSQHLIGTPMYMAPERVLDPMCIDPRSDVYAVGLLGFYLLTGREPHDPVDSMDALLKVVNERVPSLSKSVPEVSGELAMLINDCVQPDPQLRPASATEILGHLVRLQLREPWNPVRAESWWKHHAASGS